MSNEETQEIYKELLWIAEYPDKEAVMAVDDDVFSQYNDEQQAEFINSLITLGIDQISLEHLQIPMNDNTKTINISIDKRHKNIITGYSFLMNDDKDFQMLLYFGKKANPQTELKNGLYHAAKVLTTIQQNFKK